MPVQFPTAIIQAGVVIREIWENIDFFYGDGDAAVSWPALVWSLWTPDDWTVMCPGWTILPLIDAPPAVVGKRAVRRPMEQWTVDVTAVTVTYDLVDLTASELAAEGSAARAAKVDVINRERDRRLALGALHAGKLFATDDTTRTDLGGMATTAGLVVMGLVAWPASYAQGWIALDNTRLPLPTPQDGIALADKVAVTYSAIVQHARTLKDAALAGDPAAVDELAGWPE